MPKESIALASKCFGTTVVGKTKKLYTNTNKHILHKVLADGINPFEECAVAV